MTCELDSVVIVTDASGVAETGWLPWGRYRIEETTVPQHYVDVGFETEVEIRDSGRTCEIEVENEPTKGYIRITKTDRLNGIRVEKGAISMCRSAQLLNRLYRSDFVISKHHGSEISLAVNIFPENFSRDVTFP